MTTQFNNAIQLLSVAILPLLFAITLHEAAHGWVASRFGDKTALMLGRVTLNPLKHIDWLGTLVVPALTLIIGGLFFGWAKPVPVNWDNLRRPRRDAILVAIAGPAANLLMALLWAMIAKLLQMYLTPVALRQGGEIAVIIKFFMLAAVIGIQLNIIFMVLNLLPLPPLDGSRVVANLLPPRWAYYYNRIEPYGIWILLILIVTRVLFHIIYPPIMGMLSLIQTLFGLT